MLFWNQFKKLVPTGNHSQTDSTISRQKKKKRMVMFFSPIGCVGTTHQVNL